jgi:hypothetical protein
MKISNDVSDVLLNSTIEGNLLFLPVGDLDRKLYLSVNKVLDAIGGKWNRKQKAHIFSESPEQTLEEILLTGQFTDSKKEYQFFETPSLLANRLVLTAVIQPDETKLEPNAGKAGIAKFMPGCDCIELMDENRKYLAATGYNLVGDDFLKFEGEYDVIVANPPFSKQQDIDHVTHMIKIAKRCVVSVVSASVMWRTDKKTVKFRELIDELGGTIEPLPDDSFKESGTMVKTCVVHLNFGL